MTKKIQLENRTLLLQAVDLIKIPTLIALAITPIRFALEYMGVNENYIFLIGLLWFTMGVSIYWSFKHYKRKNILGIILISLLIYSPISRVPVAFAWWIDLEYNLGTHYGLYFESFSQVLLNHMVYGSLVQIIPSFVIALITTKILIYKNNVQLKGSLNE